MSTTPDIREILYQAKLYLNADDGLLREFVNDVITVAVDEYGLDDTSINRERLIDKLLAHTFPLDRFEEYFKKAWNETIREGVIPDWVNLFQERGEIAEEKITPAVRDHMVAFLLHRGVDLSDPAPSDVEDDDYKKFEEHLADAYHHALEVAVGREDPIGAAKAGQSVSTWEFDVDTFEDLDDQETIPENIKASGALFYLYYLCERMGIFKVVDALVLNWAAGAIDIVNGAGADKLYRYWKMREERMAEEERGIVYRRVLNFGEGRLLSRMNANEYFPELWNKLMSEVADYIGKVEKAQTSDDTPLVSRTPIQLAASELQYNLTEYATGMVHMQTREIHSVYKEAVEILRDEQVLSHFGGRGRRNMWKIIEQVSKQEFGQAPNVNSIRTLAVDGYKVFDWLVDANTEEEGGFQDFLRSAEAWIIAAGADEEGMRATEPEDEFVSSEEDDFFENGNEEDEFEELTT